MRKNYDEISDDTPERNDEEFLFREKVSEINQKIKNFKELINNIRELSEKIGTSRDNINLIENLQTVNKKANDLVHVIGKEFKVLSNMRAHGVPEQRIRDTQVEKLANSFGVVLRLFQSIQQKTASKEKATLIEVRKHTDVPPLLGLGNQFQDQQMILEEQQDVIPLEEIQEREQAIKKIEQDIMGVNEVMKNLAVMIHEQGEVIDSIETHIEMTTAHVESANTQLIQARDYASEGRRRMCYCLIFLVVVVIVIIIIFVVKFRSK